jgi:putative oxidoreductase
MDWSSTMERFQTTLLPALGRVLLGYIFVMSGFGKLTAGAATIGYIASAAVPMPSLAYVLAVAVELGGGLLLLGGLFTRWVGLALAVFCLFTAFVFHGFGDMNNSIHAMKNIAMAGGFLYVAAYGAGAWSLDALRLQRRGGLAHA